jgi:tripartite-type tricarboxylate transporter receptor subunit TctC
MGQTMEVDVIKLNVMRRALVGLGLASALLSAPSWAQSDVEKFYAGKTVDLMIGSAPGGGYYIYATVLARHMRKHLPGRPNVVTKNAPGAASLVAANLLYNTQPKDGTVFGALFMSAIMEPLIGDVTQTHFDPRGFSFVGSANRETFICVAWHTSEVKSLEDMFTKELIIGTSGITSAIHQYPAVLNGILKTKFKMVAGYKGSHEAALAMERGETGGICGLQWSSFASTYQHWLDDKKVRIIAQISLPGGDPALNAMGVPTIWQYVKSDADKKTLDLFFAQFAFGRPYVLPPGVPAERVTAIRRAFDATMKDPEFLAEAEKLKLGIDPVSGEDVQKLVADIYATPKEEVERARQVLK